MGQEFFINSQQLEDKIRQLLPSQGGAGAGFDLSASTEIIPIVDLTETATGSSLRADLQTALSHGSCTPFEVINTTTTLVTTTGYFRVFGTVTTNNNNGEAGFILNDGATDKLIYNLENPNTTTNNFYGASYDFNVFIPAGNSLIAKSSNAFAQLSGNTRQIADIFGDIISPN